MEIYLKFSEITFCLHSEREILIEEDCVPFLIPPTSVPDITIRFSWNWTDSSRPSGKRIGEDILHYYYANADRRFCELRGGDKGPVSCTSYTADFTEVICTINEPAYHLGTQTLKSLLRMIPICHMFTYFQTIFLHSSQVAYHGKGILFTAPSGTGKTTQAKLWNDVCGSDIVCNDRTLIRKIEREWRTFRYPLDGSEPCAGSPVYPLRAVVYLKQGPINEIVRLNPRKALALLMTQMVIDHWDCGIREQSLRMLLSMIENIPVYELTCTPDPRAVEELKRELERGI